MPESPVTSDVHQTLDVQLDFLSKISFYPALILDYFPNLSGLFLGQFANPLHLVDARLLQDLLGTAPPDAVDIRQPDLYSFLVRYVHPGYSCHKSTS